MKRLAIPRKNGAVFMIDIEQESATDNEILTSHEVIYELYLENKRLNEVNIPNVMGSFEPTDEQIEQASKKYLEVIWDIPKDKDEFQLCDEYKEAFIGMLKILKESV